METTKRPPPADSAAVWDSLLQAASQHSPGNTPASAKRSGLAKLLLQPEAQRSYLKRQDRSIAGIEPALREAIRCLVGAESPWPLFLHGPAGTGKTCAALCVLDHAIGVYFTTASLCQHLIQSEQGRLVQSGTHGSSTIWPETVWLQLGAAPLMVLDELGSRANVSDHHYETVKRLLDERVGRPLIVCSNLDLDAIARLYDDRIASRLAAGTIVQLKGRDRRIEP